MSVDRDAWFEESEGPEGAQIPFAPVFGKDLFALITSTFVSLNPSYTQVLVMRDADHLSGMLLGDVVGPDIALPEGFSAKK